MRPAKFEMDFLGSRDFEGYTYDEDWNGFACPHFTYEQAMQIVEAWIEEGSPAKYDESEK